MRRSTIIYILLVVILLGAYYYLNNRKEPVADIAITAEPNLEEPSYLFTPADGVPTYIRIQSKDLTVVEVVRGEDNVWALIQPIEGAADQGSVEAAASQIAVMQVLDRLPDIAPQDVGLDDPQYRMILKFTSGVERNVDIGVITPTESGYYVRVNGGEIVIVSNSSVDSLLGLLSNPPYPPTETPPPPTPQAVSP